MVDDPFRTNLYFQLHHSNTIKFASVSYFKIFFIFFSSNSTKWNPCGWTGFVKL